MMNTPICDFLREYARKNTLRLHMPGHKGVSLTGVEGADITEVFGADSLYEAEGIIAQSEENASMLFGCRTLYSTEGASQCIRGMLYLLALRAKQLGKKPLIAAGRNAHKTFLTAAALLDLEVQWLYPGEAGGYLSCDLTATQLEAYLENAEEKPIAVYLTSPDYLGNTVDIEALAKVCHKHGALLAVDNAHGAYLRFLPQSRHPMDLGADLCCDSAHKTLPALTGAAYLHLSGEMDRILGSQAKNAMMVFGSTSPSYLILQSLDAVNLYLDTYPQRLADFCHRVCALKQRLSDHGYVLYGNEPLKVAVDAKAYGYTGHQLAEHIRRHNMEPEFADQDYLVLMLTPEISADALEQLASVLCRLPKKAPLSDTAPALSPGRQVMSIREAMLSDSEILPAQQCLGRVLAVPTVGCPPAVPILVCGEEITRQAIDCLCYYGITHCCVVKA
jgi:arginine/lysine/ornithine decarboxylase